MDDEYSLDNGSNQNIRDTKSQDSEELDGPQKIFNKVDGGKAQQHVKLGLSVSSSAVVRQNRPHKPSVNLFYFFFQISDLLATPKSFRVIGQNQNRAMSQASTAFDGFENDPVKDVSRDRETPSKRFARSQQQFAVLTVALPFQDFDEDDEEDDDEDFDDEEDDEEFDHEYRSHEYRSHEYRSHEYRPKNNPFRNWSDWLFLIVNGFDV